MEAQVTKTLLELSTGDIIRHNEKGGRYVIEDLEAYFSELPLPFDEPMIGYRALDGEKKKWFRPKCMFTEDRFTIEGNVYDIC